MQRYFVKQRTNENSFVIDADDRHHMIKVMRMEIGDKIICVDPNGDTLSVKLQKLPMNKSLQTLYNG